MSNKSMKQKVDGERCITETGSFLKPKLKTNDYRCATLISTEGGIATDPHYALRFTHHQFTLNRVLEGKATRFIVQPTGKSMRDYHSMRIPRINITRDQGPNMSTGEVRRSPRKVPISIKPSATQKGKRDNSRSGVVTKVTAIQNTVEWNKVG